MPVRALVLGALTGSRSATPLGMLALRYDQASLDGAWKHWPVFRSRVGRGVLTAALVGELVGDKLPKTPARISPGGIIGRTVSGAIAGLVIGTVGSGRDRRVEGAVFGAVGAVIGSYVGYFARTGVVAGTGLPDVVVALVEDAIAVGGSAALITGI